MLTVIIPTHESERTLVPTLTALVPGVLAGLLAEVIVADAGSSDATSEVADVAGCRFMASAAPLGARLREAAATTRTSWLLFLRAGTVAETSWVPAVERFIAGASKQPDLAKAAVFRPSATADLMRPTLSELIALLRAAFGRIRPEQGLLIARRFYDKIGGHPDHGDAEAALLRKLGRRRIAMLTAGATFRGRGDT